MNVVTILVEHERTYRRVQTESYHRFYVLGQWWHVTMVRNADGTPAIKRGDGGAPEPVYTATHEETGFRVTGCAANSWERAMTQTYEILNKQGSEKLTAVLNAAREFVRDNPTQ